MPLSYSPLEELDSFQSLEKIYHKGQDLSWVGKDINERNADVYGMTQLTQEQLEAIGEIFTVILWGELAAWDTSNSLSLKISSIGAKMAATSQAHDEARHFFAFRDYLRKNDIAIGRPNAPTESLLNNVIDAECVGKKLLGMQLMIEPVAITIFRFVRSSNVDPILSELLKLVERDEARHIALGVKYLPSVISSMSFPQKVSLMLFQIKILSLEVDGLRCLEESFNKLGIDSNQVYSYAESKQIAALEELASELGIKDKIWKPMVKAMQIQKNLAFSKKKHEKLAYSITMIFRRILLGA